MAAQPKFIRRSLVGVVQEVDWKALAQELALQAPHDATARRMLEALCHDIPELQEEFGALVEVEPLSRVA